MSVSSGSDITIPIQDSPPPPPSPYAGTNGGSKGNDASSDNKSSGGGVGGTVTIIDTSAGGGKPTGGKTTPEPRGDVTVTVGFVNEAYQDHSPDHHNHHSEKNGHAKMTNGQKKSSNGAISISVPGEGNEKGGQQQVHLNEAVNPELINMNILNTIPDKPNPEYGPYDNLDEYFVPVNTHKKFLRRSEKLYVTKDKRKETHWKKYICWVLGASILAAIVTIAVLAGIGLIPQKSPNHFESVVGTTSATESSSSSGNLSSEDAIISSSPESSLPSSTEINTPPSVPADATHVPMAADIQFHIPDLGYEAALNDKTSDRFQELASEVQDAVKDILRSRTGLETVYSRVTEFAPGSVFVKMRIGWLDQAMEYAKVTNSLANVTSVGPYSILPISIYRIVNQCKFNNNNGCSHNCSYSYIQLDFFCSCGDDSTLFLAEDKKTCLSINDATSSTTSEVPLLPEFSSYSPSSVSEEEGSPAPPTSSSSEATIPEIPSQSSQEEEELPTSQPEEEHDDHHRHDQVSEEPAVSHEQSELEAVTEADLPTSSIEHVSQEQHHEVDMIPILNASSTSTTTEAPLESVSEEIIEPEHHHEEEHSPIIVPAETTTTAAPSTTSTSTTSTPEPLPSLISSSEETHHLSSAEETTDHSVVPVSSGGESHSQEDEVTSHGVTEQSSSAEHHLQNGTSSFSEELGRSESLEAVNPTEPVPSQSNSSENSTLVESVRDVSSEQEEEQHDHDLVVPTQIPEEIEETTVIPPAEPAAQVPEDEIKPVENNSAEEETATAVSGDNNDDNQDVTTVIPASAGDEVQESELGEPHDITPIDVLSFSTSSKGSTSTTPSSVVASIHSEEQNQGRSASSSFETSSEVENINDGSNDESTMRSQNLTDDENEGVTETNRNRAPRLFPSSETSSSMQLLTNDQEKSGERNDTIVPVLASENEQEPPRPSQNVTESASVETADENPELASVVTKTSSEDSTDGASREATSPISGSQENASSQSQSSSSENNNISQGPFDSSSASGESSQESPVVPKSESESGESTTFTPLSLHHDIDINYLGNNTEDRLNSEPIQPPSDVESVEDEHVANHETEKTSDKLVIAPGEATTVAPFQAEREELQSHEEIPEAPVSGESGESRDETPGTTTRGITASVEELGNDQSLESQNRDHRDTNADTETPFAARIAETVEESVTTEVPLMSSTSTTTSTTAAPVPEVTLVDINAQTTTTTTTTTAPVSEVSLADLILPTTSAPSPIAATNDTVISSVNSDSNSDSYSMESAVSGSLEESPSSSSHTNSHEETSSSREGETSVSEPTQSSASYEAVGPSSSLETHNTSADDDHINNELT